MLSSSISSNCDARISAMLGALGSCSRIKHTPMPFAYIVHLRCATPQRSTAYGAPVDESVKQEGTA